MTMTPPRRARFQIHLSTAIVLMFVAGGLIWANVIPAELNSHIVYKKLGRIDLKIRRYGYPFEVAKTAYLIVDGKETLAMSFNKDYTPEELFERTTYQFIPLDILVGILHLFAVWFLLEWLIRWRAARKGR